MFTYPVTAEFHADAPPQAVWSAFEAVARWPEVIPDLSAVHMEPPGALLPGNIIYTRIGPAAAPVEMEYRVVEAEAPRHLLLETETADWLGRTGYTIATDDTGARVTVLSTMQVTGRLLRLQMFTVGRTLNQQREDALRARTRALLSLAEKIAAGA